MASMISKIEEELGELIRFGESVYCKLLLESKDLSYDEPVQEMDDDEDVEDYNIYLKENEAKRDTLQSLKKKTEGLGHFSSEFEKFYIPALRVVKALAPERLEDFVKQYKDDKRKSVDVSTYLISDAIVGYKNSFDKYDKSSALPRFYTQISILKAIQNNAFQSIMNIDHLLRADIFDSELESAEHLLSKSHVRAAGAVAGVVLEAHLGKVAALHGYTTRKKNSTIADFNEHLKSENLIDVVVWRRIQSLGDIRNLCDHPKKNPPSNDDVEELIRGVKRVIKEIY